MMVKDDKKKEALIDALDENGKNWDKIATSVNQPIEVCKKGYEELKIELKRIENKRKASMMRTGGGPGPSDGDDYNPLNKLKKLIEPQVDGLFTIYDDDATLMTQYQESIPEEERMESIEGCNISILSDIDLIAETSDSENMGKIKILPKGVEGTPVKKKKTASESFRLLAEVKLELFRIVKDILRTEAAHKMKINEVELKIKLKELELM